MKQFIQRSSIVNPLVLALCSVFIAGCSHTPRKVEASLPLVAPNYQLNKADLLPPKYWAVLSDVSAVTIQHNKFKIQLGPLYSSALGMKCRSLFIEMNETETRKRIACSKKQEDIKGNSTTAWYLTKNILEVQNEVNL